MSEPYTDEDIAKLRKDAGVFTVFTRHEVQRVLATLDAAVVERERLCELDVLRLDENARLRTALASAEGERDALRAKLDDWNDEGSPEWQRLNELRMQSMAERDTLAATVRRLREALEDMRREVAVLGSGLMATKERNAIVGRIDAALGESTQGGDGRTERQRMWPDCACQHGNSCGYACPCAKPHMSGICKRHPLRPIPTREVAGG